jgi:hypothetical protein
MLPGSESAHRLMKGVHRQPVGRNFATTGSRESAGCKASPLVLTGLCTRPEWILLYWKVEMCRRRKPYARQVQASGSGDCNDRLDATAAALARLRPLRLFHQVQLEPRFRGDHAASFIRRLNGAPQLHADRSPTATSAISPQQGARSFRR